MKGEFLSSITLAVISLMACIGAGKLGIGQFNSPGPGFFPFVLGCVTGVLSLAVIAMRIRQSRGSGPPVRSSHAEAGGLIKVACLLAALVGYGLLLEKIGYVFTTLIIFALLLKVVDKQKWYVVLASALTVAIVSYLFFDRLLGVPLPKSILGI